MINLLSVSDDRKIISDLAPGSGANFLKTHCPCTMSEIINPRPGGWAKSSWIIHATQ